MDLALACGMKLDERAVWATGLTVVLMGWAIPLLQTLIKHPGKIFSVVLPYLLVITLIYFFWNRRLH
jgi:hypothetical protein